MRIIIYSLLCFLIFTLTGFSFPLKKLKKGEQFDFKGFQSEDVGFKEAVKKEKIKVLLLMRSDKPLSVKIGKQFVKMCSKKDIVCFIYDLKSTDKAYLEEKLDKFPKNIKFVIYNGDIIETLGIYTLPVTIFLDKKNVVVDAIGYEGQYLVKTERFIDYLTGKISKEEFEKYSKSDRVVRRRSILPDINFIKRLVKSGQKQDALDKLAKLKIDEGITKLERVKLAEALILLGKNEEAVKLLKPALVFIDAKFYYGLALYNLRKYDEALDVLKSIEKIYPRKRKVYYLLGKIYKIRKDYATACSYFERSCEKNLID